MKKRRKVLLVCKERNVVELIQLAQKLEIKFLISSNLEDAIRTISRCGEDHLSSVIADLYFTSSDTNDEKKWAIDVVAHSSRYCLPTLIHINKKDFQITNDLENLVRFSELKKYPILKKGVIDWEKAIYELNFFMTR